MNKGGVTFPISSQMPRPSDNSGMHAILDAALGLTSLGAPSPTRSSTQPQWNVSGTPRPTIDGTAAEARVVTQDLHKSMFMDSTILKTSPAALKPVLNNPIAALSMPPVPHSAAAMRPFDLKNSSMMWSSVHIPQMRSSNSLHLSDAAMAMDRFSVSERVAMMDRAAALASAGLAPARSGYNPYSYPPPPSYPKKGPAPSSYPSILNHYDNDENMITKTFPEILLEIMSNEENAHIISWLPHGRGFIIHDKARFNDIILPQYFDGAKFTSFTRRLKRWSFVRVPRGPELGAYYNKNFQRDQPELIERMRYKKEGGKLDKAEKKKQNQEKDVRDKVDKEDEGKTLSSSKAKAPMNEPSGLPGQDQGSNDLGNHHPIFRNHILDTKISPEIKHYFTDPQESAMPLPSALPKRTKMSVSGVQHLRDRNAILEQRLRSTSTSALKEALMYAQMEASRHRPSLVSTEDMTNERRILEAQREMLLARSMGLGRLSGYAATGATSMVSPRMASETPGSPNSGMRDLSLRLAPPFVRQESGKSSPSSLEDELRYHATLPRLPKVAPGEFGSNQQVAAVEHSNSSSGREERPVMMTREEEEDFSRYLLLQRKRGYSAV